ncbi:MAG: hypothetical protein V2I63_12000 [Pseudomonadales bacterium]|nr:hypothetical protein [Pseudomonadales bacterium]
MARAPLSHHSILALVAPLTRIGRRVDLEASDRMARRIAFRTVEHGSADTGERVIRERLILDCAASEGFVVERSLDDGQGLCSRDEIRAPSVDGVARWLASSDPRDRFPEHGGIPTAESVHLGVDDQGHAAGAACLRAARALVRGLDLRLDTDTVPPEVVRFTLTPEPGSSITWLPSDLLALLGRRWRRLEHDGRRWRASYRSTRSEAARAADLRACFARTVVHLDQVLGAPPTDFHARFAPLRWRVAARRALPLALCVAVPLVFGAITIWAHRAGFRLHPLALQVPPLMMVGAAIATAREIPILEWPPRPGPLPADAWQPLGAGPDAQARAA